MPTRPAAPPAERAPGQEARPGTALRLFLTCWLIYALHFATNTVRELYPVLSLGDRMSFDVSEYLGLHPDIFEVPGRGAFINNNPGASILGAVPYGLARPLIDRLVERAQQGRAASGGRAPEYNVVYPLAQEFHRRAYERGLDVKFGLAAAVTQVFLMAPISAASAVAMFSVLVGRALSARAALFLALLYAFATPVFYRTAQLNHNLLVGHLAFFAFVLLWRPGGGGAARHPRPARYLLAGLLTGWTVVLDYSGLLVVLGLGAYAVARHRDLPAGARSAYEPAAFAGGVLAAGAVLAGYQWAAFGNPILPAQRLMPATALSNYGYSGLGWPQADLLWETAFGLRFGLFTSAPLLLLALYVPGWLGGRAGLVGRRETWLIVGLTLAFFLLAAANQYGRLQFNSGVRYVVPVTPFLFLLAASVLLRLPWRLALAVGVAATYWSWCLAMYRDVEQGLGVLESIIHVSLEGPRLPWLTTLERLGYVPSGAYSLIILGLAGLVVWVLWRVDLPAARLVRPPAVERRGSA